MNTVLSKPHVPEKDSAGLRFLYNTFVGRCILRVLRAKWISKIAGAFLDTTLSKAFIKPFLKNNEIDINEYECSDFSCFNDCFCRKIKAGMRPVDMDDNALVSPCDSYLSVYKIREDSVYPVKQSSYTVTSLLKNEQLAKEFENGFMFVFRLCVKHYHRYIYAASGDKSENVHLNGTLHTVRPVALYKRPVFCENSREYAVIETEKLGKIVQMEVGALLVGKIHNFHGAGAVVKGEEKGTFLYGGSTVILLCKANEVKPYEELIINTEKGLETPVKQGERINEEI